MGKRSTFDRRDRDYYPTPVSAIKPLVPHLPAVGSYIEPCAGASHLIRGLAEVWPGGDCVYASDIEPQSPGIARADLAAPMPLDGVDLFITNPPWPAMGQRGEPVISIARHLSALRPTWLLLSSDFAFNAYFGPLSPICRMIVAVGRVSWEGNGVAGKDNAAWYLFDDRLGSQWPGRSVDPVFKARGVAA